MPLGAFNRTLYQLVEREIVIKVGRRFATGELDDVRDQTGELLELRHDARQGRSALRWRQPLEVAQDLDIGPQARERSAQLVAGIHDQLTLRAE